MHVRKYDSANECNEIFINYVDTLIEYCIYIGQVDNATISLIQYVRMSISITYMCVSVYLTLTVYIHCIKLIQSTHICTYIFLYIHGCFQVSSCKHILTTKSTCKIKTHSHLLTYMVKNTHKPTHTHTHTNSKLRTHPGLI